MKNLSLWVEVFRIHTLSASYIPVIFGTLYAYYSKGRFSLGLFIAMLISSILIQMSANLFNDFFDFKKGIDNINSVGKSTALLTGTLSPKLILTIALFFVGISGLLGLYIVYYAGFIIAILGAISISVGLLYSGGPYPISASPFGELFSGFFMGTIIIGISYFIQTNIYSLDIFLVSIPFALLIAAILTANNIRDLNEDIAGGRRTLAIILGKEKAVIFLKSISWIAFFLIPLFIALKILPIYSIIVFLTSIKIEKAGKIFMDNNTPKTMMPAMGLVAKNNFHFGVLLIISLIIAILI